MPVQSNKLNFKGQNIYIGIDVHLKSWNVCVYVGGLKIKPFSQTPSAAVLKSHLETNYPGGTYYSAYESGFCGFLAIMSYCDMESTISYSMPPT